MSRPITKDEILFRQRLLKSCGYYDGKLDGFWGPKTEKAEEDFQAETHRLRAEHGAFDDRTEGNIIGLHVKTQEAARIFMNALRGFDYKAKIISGTRTYAEQDKLYALGRGLFPDRKKQVTNARGGESNHNFGLAWDLGLFENGRYMDGKKPNEAKDQQAYARVGQMVLAHDKLKDLLIWGGTFSSFLDPPHYQLKIPVTGGIAIRLRFEEGKSYFV